MNYQDVVRNFAERTQANLLAIEKLREEGAAVYETTQLVNSMLGLLVFPREEFVAQIPETPFAELLQDGWPAPRVGKGFPEVPNLRELIRYLRNAICGTLGQRAQRVSRRVGARNLSAGAQG